jgi:enoyl-CoA hydratase
VDPGPAVLAHECEQIDRLFAGESLAAIVSAVAADGGAFARRVAEALATKSPTALHLASRQLRQGAQLAFDDCLRMEWRMVSRVPTELPDFYEGVRAAVIDKDNKPRWSPTRLEDVDPATLDRFFAPSPRGELELY